MDELRNFYAFLFNVTTIPGFMEYATVYSHFRIKKCMLTVSRDRGANATGLSDNYLLVGSRPFAALVAPQALQKPSANPGGGSLPPIFGNAVPSYSNRTMVPPQTEDALRQTRWQRVVTPNTTRPYINVGFFPYTMIGTFGPSSIVPDPPTAQSYTAVAYQRVWEARKWMPFTWAGGTNSTAPITFFGPYLVTETAEGSGEVAGAVVHNVTLTVYVQFKGQK